MDQNIRPGNLVRITFDNRENCGTSLSTELYIIDQVTEDYIRVHLLDNEDVKREILKTHGRYWFDDTTCQFEFLSGRSVYDGGKFTGNFRTDIQILALLDGECLSRIRLVNKYMNQLYLRDELWIEKILLTCGVRGLAIKREFETYRELYLQLAHLPATVGGANIALVRGDSETLSRLKEMGINPDINEPSDGPFNSSISGRRLPPRFVEFLANTNLGPQVAGSFESIDIGGDSYTKVTENSLDLLDLTQLKDILYFLQPKINNQANPLYGIVNPHGLSLLFKIQNDYNNLMKGSADSGIWMSQDIKHYFGDNIKDIIDTEVGDLLDNNSEDFPIEEIERWRRELKMSVDDHNVNVTWPQFPKSYEYYHYSLHDFDYSILIRLTYFGRISPRIRQTEELKQEVIRVYSLPPDISPDDAIGYVITLQNRIIKLASELITGKIREKKRNRKKR